MASSRKKVIVRRFNRELISGYLPASNFVTVNSLDLLDLSGRVLQIPLNEIKLVSFVRDFNTGDMQNPERLSRKTFLARPRNEGLWLRLTLKDGDQLEGLAPPDLSLVDSLINDLGLQLSPPDVRSNTQRLFIPRSAIADLQVIAVITTPSKRKPLPQEDLQDTLFHTPPPPNSRPN